MCFCPFLQIIMATKYVYATSHYLEMALDFKMMIKMSVHNNIFKRQMPKRQLITVNTELCLLILVKPDYTLCLNTEQFC